MLTDGKPVIFSGPTIQDKDILEILPAHTLGPASQGDIIGAYMKYSPPAIGLIDGYYEKIPAVWHKEILFVMSQGVHVYGAASMGAIRAAELSDFGMVGSGIIYEMYVSGEIEDDDEVAMLHGPSNLLYPRITEAMINVRITLKKAHMNSIISSQEEAEGISYFKSLYYKERTTKRLIDFYRGLLNTHNFRIFETWINHNFVDQKNLDAIELLRTMSLEIGENCIPKKVSYSFYKTSYFNSLYNQIKEGEP